MNMLRLLVLKLRGNKGQGMVEYGLIVSLIAVAVIASLVILGPQIGNLFTSVADKITPAP